MLYLQAVYLLVSVEKYRREKISEKMVCNDNADKTRCNKKLLHLERNPNANSTPTKVATLFNTNRTYVNDAARIKKESPEKFEQVKCNTDQVKQIFKTNNNISEYKKTRL